MVSGDDYLLPEVRSILNHSNAERIQHIKSELWIGYTRAVNCVDKLGDLITFPKKQRMPNLLIIGPTNNGKSMIVEKFKRLHPSVQYCWDEEKNKPYDFDMNNIMPVLTIQMPSNPNLKRFYLTILSSLNVSDRYYQYILSALENVVLSYLKMRHVRILIIDEIHNILAAPKAMQLEFLNLLRFLGNSLQIPLVCVGTKEAYMAIRSDPQLENRFEPFLLPLWKDDYHYRALLASFIKLLPLKHCSDLTQNELAKKILSKSEGILGEIVELIKRAAITAINDGTEKITLELMDKTDYYSPSERRGLFEKGLLF